MDIKASESIDDYVNSDLDSDTKKLMSIQYKGKYTEFKIHRLPCKLLRFRLQNTRFEIQKLQEEKTTTPIDQDTETGERRIIKLLLGSPDAQNTKDLIKSIEKDGQLKAGVISHDGAVVDGNRRLACLKTLYEDTSEDKFAYFNTIRLPEGATEEDIFKIEAQLQWAKEYRVDYDPVNKYMMLKKALNFRMNTKQIAELTNQTEEYVKTGIEELKLIDDYLINRTKPEAYYLIEGQTEVFTEAVKEVASLKSKKEIDNIAKYKKLFFSFVDVNNIERKTITNEHIRKLNKAFNQDDQDAISIFEDIKSTDNISEIKTKLAKAIQEIELTSIFGKPEKLAGQLKEIAERLKKRRLQQKFSDKTKDLIEAAIKILEDLE